MMDPQDEKEIVTDSFDSDNVRSRRLAAPKVDLRETSFREEEERSAASVAEKRRACKAQTATEADSESSSEEKVTANPKARRPFRLEEYIGQVLSGNILTRAEVRRRYPYIFFMALLMLLYIANGYHIQKLHRRHDKLTAQLKELRSRSLTLSSIRMTATRQSEIVRELQERGIPLHESLVPPQVIDK